MNPLIVALDVPSAAEATVLVERLGDRISFYKVGLELYAAAGIQFVRDLIAGGKDVFLDLKLYDIPATVSRAVAAVAAQGVRFTTVHARGQVMRAAAEGRAGSPLKLLAVTVLTSFDQTDLAEMGYTCSVSELVEQRARKAMECGIDGVVCSPLEVGLVRRITGPQAVLVTPGVRSAGAGKGDQKRVATPQEALRDGANYLVVGRQITRAPDPAGAAQALLAECR